MGQVEVPMGPTPLVIASRFRPVWRRPCTRWRSAPGRASTDGARALRPHRWAFEHGRPFFSGKKLQLNQLQKSAVDPTAGTKKG